MLYDGAYALLDAGEYGAFTIEAVARSAKLDALLHGDVATEDGVLGELRAYLTMWARLALGPVGLGIYLMALGQRDTSPAIARSYENQGMSHAVDVLRAWLAKPLWAWRMRWTMQPSTPSWRRRWRPSCACYAVPGVASKARLLGVSAP